MKLIYIEVTDTNNNSLKIIVTKLKYKQNR